MASLQRPASHSLVVLAAWNGGDERWELPTAFRKPLLDCTAVALNTFWQDPARDRELKQRCGTFIAGGNAGALCTLGGARAASSGGREGA